VDPQTEDGLIIEREVLSQIGAELTYARVRSRREEEVMALASEADAVLVVSAPITRRVLASLKRCKVVVRYGIGVDNVDVAAATEMGIAVVNVPDLYIEEVSNHVIMVTLALARHLIPFHKLVSGGGWRRYPLPTTGRVLGQTLGIVGFGNIGKAVARKAQALGLKIAACDPYVQPQDALSTGVALLNLRELMAGADYVTLHVPLTQETDHMIGEADLRLMKPSAFLINTARGGIVDEASLLKALGERWIAGAALDVFEREPLSPENPLLKMDNVVLTPHVAFHSDYSFDQVRRRVAEEAARVLTGKRPLHLVNPEVQSRLKLIDAREGSLTP